MGRLAGGPRVISSSPCPGVSRIVVATVSLRDDTWRERLETVPLGFEERAQASALPPARRETWCGRRRLVRFVLATHANVPVTEANWRRDLAGRPRMPKGPWLSWSERDGFVAVALCDDRPVGIDVESESALDGRAVTELFPFWTRRERMALRTVNPRGAVERWCAKEALFKASGAATFAPEAWCTEATRAEWRRVRLGNAAPVVVVAGESLAMDFEVHRWCVP